MKRVDNITYSGTEKMRLDICLAGLLEDHSRSYLQTLIRDGLVLVDGKAVTAPRFEVSGGENIEVSFPEPKQIDLTPREVEFDVIDVQPDFLVVNKPAGLSVHPSSTEREADTLVHGLLYKFSELSEFDDDERPGIVHRLDKDTSGVLLVARNPRGKTKLGAMFQDRNIKKCYTAIVAGEPPREGTIDFDIGRHPVVRCKMYHLPRRGRTALTEYCLREYLDDAAVLDVQIMTGRTHQIRVHCAAIGHGIVGDKLYGKVSKLIKRQALHAGHIEFEYDGLQFSYDAPLPDDMESLIKLLRISE
ncbi:RluA family pseudouridine synthase [bacterium]|nr:RluA family pseudouridine synthase [bacterium]